MKLWFANCLEKLSFIKCLIGAEMYLSILKQSRNTDVVFANTILTFLDFLKYFHFYGHLTQPCSECPCLLNKAYGQRSFVAFFQFLSTVVC